MTNSTPPPRKQDGLTVSVVVYKPDLGHLESTLNSMASACKTLWHVRPVFPVEVYIVDNGGLPSECAAIDRLRADGMACHMLSGQGNVGFGRGA